LKRDAVIGMVGLLNQLVGKARTIPAHQKVNSFFGMMGNAYQAFTLLRILAERRELTEFLVAQHFDRVG